MIGGKHEIISLRTDLKEVPISNNLRSWTCQNFTEILNQPKKVQKKVLSLKNLSIGRNSSSMKRKNSLISEINYEKFNASDFFQTEGSSFQSNHTTVGEKSLTFKMLMDQDYSQYVSNLKKIYPSFKFNHYSKYSEQIKESNLEYNNNNNDNNMINNNKIEAQSSSILTKLNIHSSYLKSPENFVIYKNILEISDIDRLVNISHDFDNKGEIIEYELNRTLANNSHMIYNYIERNMSFAKMIQNYTINLAKKNFSKNELSKKFIFNSSKLLLTSIKKQNSLKTKNFLFEIKKLYDGFKCINNMNNDDNANIDVNELSKGIDNIKEIISKLRKTDKKLNLINLAEKELMNYGNQNEEKLMKKFAESVKQLFNLSMQFSEENDDKYNNIKNVNINKKYDIMLDKEDEQNNISNKNTNKISNQYYDKDFEYSSPDNNTKIKFILIYKYINDNNENKNKYIINLIITLLEVLDLIIKDNVDIFCIIEKLEGVIKNLIINTFDIIQGKSELNQVDILYIIANGFITITSNYNYLLNLFQKNFGLVPKIFTDLTNCLISEQKKLVKVLISSSVREDVLNGETVKFLNKMSESLKICDDFMKFHNENWYEYTKEIYLEYLSSFYDKNYNTLNDNICKEKWLVNKEIDPKYQIMLDNTYKSFEELNLTGKTEQENNTEEKKSLENLILNQNNNNDKNIKHSVVNFTLEIIQFLNDLIYIYKLSNNLTIQTDIVQKCYLFTSKILLKSKEIISQGEQITDKEICAFNSHNIIFKYMMNYFMSQMAYKNIKIENQFNELNNICKDTMTNLLQGLSDEMLNDFNELNFLKYPILPPKEYNPYMKKFTRMKRLYDNMNESFNECDVIEVFNKIFQVCFDNFEKAVQIKGRINDEAMLKQFRGELLYMKKVLKIYTIINTENFRNKLEEISKGVNPDKITKKKRLRAGSKSKNENEGD